jgi:hypothetical protein
MSRYPNDVVRAGRRVRFARVVTAVTAAIIALTALVACSSSSGGDTPAGGKASASSGQAALPAGPVKLAGVEVLEPVADAGRVPLNTPVEQTWRLKNMGTTTVKVGTPTIQVLEGC